MLRGKKVQLGEQASSLEEHPSTSTFHLSAGHAGCPCSPTAAMQKAPSTLGTFLRSFRWGHVRQLDRVSRELLARAWSAGAGPGDAPFTIDLDSTICETYGLAKEGARDHGYTGKRGYHPCPWPLAPAT